MIKAFGAGLMIEGICCRLHTRIEVTSQWQIVNR